jgi:hypothetical protein
VVVEDEGHYISELALAHPMCLAVFASLSITLAWRRDEA